MPHRQAWTRRQLLGSAAALAATTALPFPLLAQTAIAGGAEDARLHALLMAQVDRLLEREPTQATTLGLDTGGRAHLRSRMPDWSPEGRAAEQAETERSLRDLRAIDRDRLSERARVSFDIAEFELALRERMRREFPFHTSGFGHRPGPYGVTQLQGFYTSVSSFFDSQQPVNNATDADAYLARAQALPALFDADTRITMENAGSGVVAPRFILEKAVRQLTSLRDGETREKTLVQSLARRTQALGLTGYDQRAATLWDGPIRAALTRQIEALNGLLPRAGEAAGVGRLSNGAAYYAQTLKLHTTTDMTAELIHRMGLEQVADLEGRIDALFRAQGRTSGTVRERIEALSREQSFPNTDEGRAQIIAYLNGRLDAIRPRLPRMFNRIPRARYEIRRVPPEIEAGAPGGSAQRGSLDGSRPGIFYINLRDTADWPRFTLPTLAFHEAAPGHLFDGAMSMENGELPLYRQLSGGTAHGEGWGLYSEQVADELGMYDDDPWGRIGYLSAYLFRASRLVVDTGIHALGWSRQQAIDYMTAHSAESPGSAEIEIERYICMPGQACAYKIGQTVIANLRREAEARPGFDIKAFHDLILGEGRMPLSVLERRVRAWAETI